VVAAKIVAGVDAVDLVINSDAAVAVVALILAHNNNHHSLVVLT
jgi:hypothetical protein